MTESTRATAAPDQPIHAGRHTFDKEGRCVKCGTHAEYNAAKLLCPNTLASKVSGGEPATDSAERQVRDAIIYGMTGYTIGDGSEGDFKACVEEIVSALAARELDVEAERWAFEAARKQTWDMVDPYTRAQPGSYAKGEQNGIIAALKTIKENFDIAIKRAQVTAESAPASAAPGEVEQVAALRACEQCIADFLEAYRNGCSMLILDEAVKSLRDDALKMTKKALSSIAAPSNSSPVGAKEST